MNSFAMTDTQRLAFDAVNTADVATRSNLNSAVRESVKEICGGTWNYYSFMQNQYKVFQIIAELMPAAMNASLASKFAPFAEFKDVAMGDKPYFDVQDNTIYPVVTVARGIGAIDRHRIVDKNFTVTTLMKAIKLYDEFDRFMAGKIDMGRLVDTATRAFEHYVGNLIADTIYGSYASVGTNYKSTGSFSITTFSSIMEHVKAANNVDELQIWGTTGALVNVVDSVFGYSDRAKDQANGVGYWGEYRGASMFALPQAYVAGGAQSLAVSANQLIVLPASEKIVKVVFEGDTVVAMGDGSGRSDMQSEFTFGRRVGAAALTVPEGKYGFWKFA